jgi:hypothetical protein
VHTTKSVKSLASIQSIHVSFHPQGSWHPPFAPTIPAAPSAASHQPPESAYFLAVNRNKRSMTVNFKTPEGLAIVHKLVERADILVENFVSGKLASMGLGWEDCKRINERLIYASITGEFRDIWKFWTSVVNRN